MYKGPESIELIAGIGQSDSVTKIETQNPQHQKEYIDILPS